MHDLTSVYSQYQPVNKSRILSFLFRISLGCPEICGTHNNLDAFFSQLEQAELLITYRKPLILQHKKVNTTKKIFSIILFDVFYEVYWYTVFKSNTARKDKLFLFKTFLASILVVFYNCIPAASTTHPINVIVIVEK